MEMVVTFQLARARDRDRRATLNISEPTVNRSTFYCTVLRVRANLACQPRTIYHARYMRERND